MNLYTNLSIPTLISKFPFTENNKLLTAAKALVKSAKHESTEIESCSECYLAANTKKDWFKDVCSKPHLIVWAKLKGFPFWPAKVMGLTVQHMVSVRFFGDHDRAQIPVKDCYLYSKEFPCPGGKKSNRSDLQNCISEVETHIQELTSKYGHFEYAPQKTLYDPNKEIDQLNLMLPKYKDYMEKQPTKVNTGLQFKIYKTPDNNLSMTKIQNTDHQNSPTSTIDRPAPIEIPKKPYYNSVPTKVILKRRPSGEYVVEKKRGKREGSAQKPTTNSIVAEIMKKNQGVTITKVPSNSTTPAIVEKSQTVNESVTTQLLNPFVIKTEPMEYEETPVDNRRAEEQHPPEIIEQTSEPMLISNVISIAQREQKRSPFRISRPLQQSTPVVVAAEPSMGDFEMSSNMVSIPLPMNSTDVIGTAVQPTISLSRRFENSAEKLQEITRSFVQETFEINEIKDLVLNFEKVKEDEIRQKIETIRRECEIDKKAAIDATKRKQWCAFCWKEAKLYCCWNTSYCSYDCQTKHWTQHLPNCSNLDRPNAAKLNTSHHQNNAAGSSSIPSTNRKKFENSRKSIYVSIYLSLFS